ncbi:uncharacterized protein LOC129761035 [Uranotaenia lowii]|uniref:uncharacterized protein LOC129761035 n=1 Tax=Uranotaenia lowii TaxID=190385 RepID=UPI00247A6A11|nr:uncharacterized protein LOC129761035 [Uranotaenia lowii]
MEKIDIIVDNVLCDPAFIEEGCHNEELRQLIVEDWQLDEAIYAILIAHGITINYSKNCDLTTLNDIFNVAKWTGHKHALRHKLQLWPSSLIFRKQIGAVSAVDEDECGLSGTVSSDSNQFVFEDIMRRNEKAKIVQQYFYSHKALDDKNRRSLVHVMVDYFIANKKYFSLSEMKIFSKMVSRRFPSEIAEIYFNPRDTKAGKKYPSGLFYDRFHNRNKSKIIKKPKLEDPFDVYITSVASLTSEDELTSLKNWLRNNSGPDDLVLEHWRRSTLLRVRTIKEDRVNVFFEWPRLKDINGYMLGSNPSIDIDFEKLFGEKTLLFDRWGAFVANFREFIKTVEVRDRSTLQYIDQLEKEDNPEDFGNVLVAAIFQGVVKPTRNSLHKLPTILQAQLDLYCLCNTQDDLSNAVSDWMQNSADHGVASFARIFIYADEKNLKEFRVTTEGVSYHVPTFLKSIDVIIKLKFLLKVQFAGSCELFWVFVAHYFYGFTNFSPKLSNSRLLQLLAFLEERSQ